MTDSFHSTDFLPKVSVIIPVYKAEKYLNRCLESLVNQTLREIEIILVDDGSPDNSGKICDEYAKIDNRVKVIHKENSGVSSARNVGLENATGEYIAFVDADDYVELNAYEELYSKAKKTDADAVICDYTLILGNRKNCLCQTKCKKDSAIYLTNILQGRLTGSICNKLIKASLFRQFSLCFDEDLVYCEDKLLLIKLLLKNIKIEYVQKSFYNYVNTPTSLTHQDINKIIFRWEKQYNLLCDLLRNTEYESYLVYQRIEFKKYLLYNRNDYSLFKKTYPDITKRLLIKNANSLKEKLILLLPFHMVKTLQGIYYSIQNIS